MAEEAKITVKQRKWLDAYIETGNATEAARRAGYADPEQSGWGNKKKVEIPFARLLETHGIDDATLLSKLLEGLGASNVVTADFQGEITYGQAFADYQTRLAYLNTILKLKGAFPANKTQVEAAPEALQLLRATLGVGNEEKEGGE